MDADIALISIENVTGGLPGYTQVISPGLGNQSSWIYIVGQAVTVTSGQMQPGMGYWVYMVNPGGLAGFTVTPLE